MLAEVLYDDGLIEDEIVVACVRALDDLIKCALKSNNDDLIQLVGYYINN